jgi:hypothetical protein
MAVSWQPYILAALYSPETFSGTHLCYRQSQPQGILRPEGLGKFIKFRYLIGSRIRGLRIYSLVPQPVLSRVATQKKQTRGSVQWAVRLNCVQDWPVPCEWTASVV